MTTPRLLIVLPVPTAIAKSLQLGLFDTNVQVKGYARKDGSYVAPTHGMRKKKLAKPVVQIPAPLKLKSPAPVSTKPMPVLHLQSEMRAKAAMKTNAPPIAWESKYKDPPADAATRRKFNAYARDVLTQKTDEQMTATDRQALANYSGRGGIGESLNEYYTHSELALAMWQVIKAAGIPANATVLEPSSGTGMFLNQAPPRVHVTACEYDATSSRIGKILHPEHEHHAGSFESFATTDSRLFDVVIGNPPFGLRGGTLSEDKPDIARAEDYFLASSLDKLKEGGIAAFIVPSGVLDRSNGDALRGQLLARAEFLGAQRLPNSAFAHSQTNVTCDVVFFRKRAPDVAQALLAVRGLDADGKVFTALGIADDAFVKGDYFGGDAPGVIHGKIAPGWRALAGMGNDITVTGSMAGVAEKIAGMRLKRASSDPINVADVVWHAQLMGLSQKDQSAIKRAASKSPYKNWKAGDTKIVGGETYVLQGEPLRWHLAAEAEEPASVKEARYVAEAIQAVTEDPSRSNRDAATEALDDYIKRHGNPHANKDLARVMGNDKALYRLQAAVNANGRYSDAITGRGEGENLSLNALAVSTALEAGHFTAAQLAAGLGTDREGVVDTLFASPAYALIPGTTDDWQPTEQYLTGELWPKLDAVKAQLANEALDPSHRAKFELQAKALESAIDPKSLEDVDILLNYGFIPPDVLAAFFNVEVQEYRERNPTASYKPEFVKIEFADGVYDISGGHHSMKLVGTYLNRTGLREDDRHIIDGLNRDFRTWLLSSDQRERVEDLYNRAFTGFVPEIYSDKKMDIPGLQTAFDVNAYHYSGLRWALSVGKGIIADDVGLGKTGRALMLVKLAKSSGKVKKPLIVVPKSVLANWKAECESWFPGSKVLVIGESYKTNKKGEVIADTDTAAQRSTKLHDFAQNDYDFVLMSESVWADTKLSDEVKDKYTDSDFWAQRSASLEGAKAKKVNKVRTAADQALAKLEYRKHSTVVNFDDLGVDMLVLDEAHHFKNLFTARNRFGESPKFLGGSGSSKRAADTSYKARFIREHNDGKGVFLLTATPTKNSPLEVFSMIQHVAPESFERLGIRNSEEFLDRFCEFKNDLVLGVDGAMESALVTSGFKNLDELREVMKRHIARRTAADVGLKLPDRDEREHLVTMTAEQEAAYVDLRAQAATGKDDSGNDVHIFSIMDKMGKASMDMALLDPAKYAGSVSPKYAVCAEKVGKLAADGGQIVFCENVASHERMKAALVATGIDAAHIGIINSQVTKTSSDRLKVADAFNSGKLKVVIGNTATMGEGINLQKQTSDIHHLDLPWEPASMQQRNGRGLRQGNKKLAVRIHRYLAKGSFDGYRYQTLNAKKDWMDQLWNGGDRVENLSREGNFSRDDLMVMLSSDPEAARAARDSNKSAAQAAQLAEKRAKTAAEFVRFREMSRTHARLENKGTKTAIGLEQKVVELRRRLSASSDITPDILQNPGSVVPNATTGRYWKAGAGFEVTVANNLPVHWVDGAHRFVIESVDAERGSVVARQLGSNAKLHLKAEDMGESFMPVAHDHDRDTAMLSQRGYSEAFNGMGEHLRRLGYPKPADAAEAATNAGTAALAAHALDHAEWHATPAGRAATHAVIHDAVKSALLPHLEAAELTTRSIVTGAPLPTADQAAERATSRMLFRAVANTHGVSFENVKNADDLVKLPTAMLEEHADLLQHILVDRKLNYEDGNSSGNVPMIEAGGGITLASAYNATSMLKDHKMFVPTEANVTALVNQWKEQELKRTFGSHYPAQKPSRGNNYGYSSGNAMAGAKAAYPPFNFPGIYSSSVSGNPYDMHGALGKMVKERGRAELAALANERLSHATTYVEGLEALKPVMRFGVHGDYGGHEGSLSLSKEHTIALAHLAIKSGQSMMDSKESLRCAGLPATLFRPVVYSGSDNVAADLRERLAVVAPALGRSIVNHAMPEDSAA